MLISFKQGEGWERNRPHVAADEGQSGYTFTIPQLMSCHLQYLLTQGRRECGENNIHPTLPVQITCQTQASPSAGRQSWHWTNRTNIFFYTISALTASKHNPVLFFLLLSNSAEFFRESSHVELLFMSPFSSMWTILLGFGVWSSVGRLFHCFLSVNLKTIL